MKTTSIKTAFGMYINYFFLGITRRKRLGQQLAESNSGNDITDAGRTGSCANCAGYHRFFLRLFNRGCVSNLHYINDRLFWKRKGTVTGIVATASASRRLCCRLPPGLSQKREASPISLCSTSALRSSEQPQPPSCIIDTGN